MISGSPWAWLLVTAMVGPPGRPAEAPGQAPKADTAGSGQSGPTQSPVEDEAPTSDSGAPSEPAEEGAPPGEGEANTKPDPGETSPSPDSAETAKHHFLRAQAMLEEERYSDAAREFARSYEAVPTSVALYNMALAHERAGELVEAIRVYEQYLQREDVIEPRRSEVADAIARLREQVGEFSLAMPEDIELRQIRVNREPVPVEDFPLLVMPGSVRIELVTARDGQVHVRNYEVQAGQRITVDLALFAPEVTARPKTPGRPPVPPISPPGARLPSYLFWTGLAATSASALSVLALGLSAQREAQRFSEALCPNPCTEDMAEHHPYPLGHRERAQALETATNVMIGVTAGLGVATLVVGAVALARRPRETRTARLRSAGGSLVLSW